MKRLIHISLHDIAPIHLERLYRAEEFLAARDISHLTLLWVPDFHSLNNRSNENARDELAKWIRGPHPFKIHLALHGYTHLQSRNSRKGGGSPKRYRQRRWRSSGEGEFLNLGIIEAGRRITAGREAFRKTFGRHPDTFVAPAWLMPAFLPDLLASRGFAFTETHGRILLLTEGQSLTAPVVTWATRTPRRRLISRWGCPLLSRMHSFRPILRIAMHPHDFDYPGTISSIDRALQIARRGRKQIHLHELTTRFRAADPSSPHDKGATAGGRPGRRHP